jgi:MoxR-like ATPase
MRLDGRTNSWVARKAGRELGSVTSLDQDAHGAGTTDGSAHRADGADLDTLARVTGRIRASIERVIEGKRDVAGLSLIVLLAEGHLLIEDVPGVGKTMLSKALARSIDCSVRRIQFTPDLLPSDVTGVSVFNQERREFEFRPGGIFANIVVGDEINRASPKTQSALLECMEERQVTVDGSTYHLDPPFMVIATQNPIEMEGTYALPEAQRDRFMARVSMGYPVESAEIAMLDAHTRSSPLDDLEPVTDSGEIKKLIEIVGRVHVAESVQRYAVAITTATRRSPELTLGASPRATLHLVRAARASAALAGRDYVVPDDVQELAVPVLAHRLLPTVETSMSGRTTETSLRHIVSTVPMPDARHSTT